MCILVVTQAEATAVVLNAYTPRVLHYSASLLLHTFAEVTGCPVCDKKLELRLIVFSTISSAANILLLASISVITAIVVRQRKGQGNDTSSGNEGTEATAVYDKINLHPQSTANIDTKENVAYRQTIFK